MMHKTVAPIKAYIIDEVGESKVAKHGAKIWQLRVQRWHPIVFKRRKQVKQNDWARYKLTHSGFEEGPFHQFLFRYLV